MSPDDAYWYPSRLHRTEFGWITEFQTPKGTWLPCRCDVCRRIFVAMRKSERART